MQFIYVFSKEDKDTLERLGYELVKTNRDGKVFVFCNKDQQNYDNLPVNGVFSNMLTF